MFTLICELVLYLAVRRPPLIDENSEESTPACAPQLARMSDGNWSPTHRRSSSHTHCGETAPQTPTQLGPKGESAVDRADKVKEALNGLAIFEVWLLLKICTPIVEDGSHNGCHQLFGTYVDMSSRYNYER
eukprot:scaffold632672_cov42-Prasinocladus_malaysianus.AAC.1